MYGSGEYVADATEGIAHPDDLSKPKIKKRPCPDCGYSARRHDLRTRILHHLGDSGSGRQVDVHLVSSVHYCCQYCCQ